MQRIIHNTWLDYNIGVAATLFNYIPDDMILCLGYHDKWVTIDNIRGIRPVVFYRTGKIYNSNMHLDSNKRTFIEGDIPIRILIPTMI